MGYLQTLKDQEKQLARVKSSVATIGVVDCVKGTALTCHPLVKDYEVIIKQQITKLFYAYGKGNSANGMKVDLFYELIYESYKHETPETILLFFKKAAEGEFGKFYGDPDIGTLREWFAKFLGSTIVPARERENTTREKDNSQRGQSRSLREYIQGSTKSGPVNLPDQFKGRPGPQKS